MELEEVVIDAGTDDGETIVEVGEGEKRFALHVGGCDVEGIEKRRVVVEDAEEIVVGGEEVLVFLG